MGEVKKFYLFLFLFMLSLTILQSIAFFTPDISPLGKDPEIKRIDPSYLIGGQKVRIFGKNFFTIPKSANKLWINNYPVRIVSTGDNFIEFTVPKIHLGNAKIRFFTYYLGYKSSEVIFPVQITFNSPVIKKVNDISVKPKKQILIYGEFDFKDKLFFKIDENEIEGEVLSNNVSKLTLPEVLPKGPFKIKSFYRKYSQNQEKHIDSPLSDSVILFNDIDAPVLIKLETNQKIFDSLNNEYPYQVVLYFTSGEKADVTEYSGLTFLEDFIFELNQKNQTIKPLKNGIAKVKASFIWLPSNYELSDTVNLIVQVPQKPEFHEVIISEIFPFASGLLPTTDANMDGFAKTNDDKFIEIQNLSTTKIDISGCKFFISDEIKPSYEFKENSLIDPLSYLVVFGNEAINGKLNLTNSGSTIEFACNEKTIDYAAYPAGKSGDPSWQRKDDLSGFLPHPVTLFSPGAPPPKPVMALSSSGSVTTVLPTLGIDSNIDLTTSKLKEISVFPTELLFSDLVSQQLNVSAQYESGEIKDVTKESGYVISGQQNVIKVDQNGLVTPLGNGSATIEISFGDKTIEVITNINLISKVQSKQLVINEILAAPTLDVNKDGVFKSDQDEFVEIVNISGGALDISNLIISDGVRARHTIPQGIVLENLESIVIFGGGNINNFSPTVKSQAATTGALGINNTGAEQITISTSDNRIIDQIAFDNANLQGVSQNRVGDLSFNALAAHDKFIKSVGKYSPGTRIDGSSFSLPPQDGSDLLKGSSSSSSSSSSSGGSSSSSSSNSSSSSSSSSSGGK